MEQKRKVSIDNIPKPSARRPLEENVLQIISELTGLTDNVKEIFGDHPLTPLDRRRLNSSGIRNYGFLDKTYDLTETNMQYAPGNFDRNKMGRSIQDIEALRNILVEVRKLEDAVSDALLVNGDKALRFALIYYNTVRDLSRHGDRGATEVFDLLRPFFKRRRTKTGEPTEHEVERDVRALLHGKKDGKIVIENERPHLSGGKRILIDETNKRIGSAELVNSVDNEKLTIDN